MKSLAALIKLQKTYVDEQRLMLAKLQDHLAQIEQDIAAIEIEKAREQIAAQASAEARATYGAFLRACVARERALDKERISALAAIDIARDRLAELFEEQKRYEIAETTRREAEAADERRRERIELDEIGSISHARKTD